MIQKHGIVPACLLACLVLTVSPAYGQDESATATGTSAPDCSSPIWLPDRPTLDNTPDYSTFLAQIMAYKKAKREQAAQKQACPQLYRKIREPNNNPTVVEGPETLHEALQRARQLSQLDYSHGEQQSGSTVHSFPLPQLSGNQMARDTISANLENLSNNAKPKSGAQELPLIYGAQLNPNVVNGRDAQQNTSSSVEQALPTQDQNLNVAYNANTFGGRLGQIVQSDVVDGSYLRYYYSKDGQLMLITGVLQVENCLSSCSNTNY